MSEEGTPTVAFNTKEDFADSREVHLSLGFRSPDLKPDEVSRILGLAPAYSFRRGDSFSTPAGERKRPFGVWVFSTEGFVVSDQVEAHLLAFLELFAPKAAAIQAIRGSSSVYADIRLTIRTDSKICVFGLESSTMSKLADFCDELTIGVFTDRKNLESPDEESWLRAN
jgi:hypothetical protein